MKACLRAIHQRESDGCWSGSMPRPRPSSRDPASFRKAVVKNDLDHLCDQLGMLGLLVECAASGCRGLGGLRVSRSLRVIFALMGRYPRCGRRDTAPVASRYDQERRPKIRVIVVIFSYFFFGLAASKRQLLNRSEGRNGRDFLREDDHHARSLEGPVSTSAFEQLST
jgi:hypothetical protein